MRKLPCFPCPHAAACCSYGASVTAEEHAVLSREHSPSDFVWSDEETGWRTAVRGGRCVFLSPTSTCVLHAHPSYPVVCRGFPYTQAETGGPYEGDVTICPEMRASPDR